MSTRGPGAQEWLHARPVPALVDASLRLLRSHPALFVGLAWRSVIPAALALLGLDWLVEVHPEWVDGGGLDALLPLLSALLAAACCLRGVTVGATALAVEDLTEGRTPLGPVPYLRRAWRRSPALLPLSAAGAAVLLASALSLGIPALAAAAWLLTAPAYVATGVRNGGQLRAGHGGRAVALLLLLAAGWLGVLLNIGVGTLVVLWIGEGLLDLDVAWWGRLLRPDHPFYLDVVLVASWVVFEPVLHLTPVLFAVDLRVRRQGLDLVRAADETVGAGRGRTVVAAVLAGALLLPAPAVAQERADVEAAVRRVYVRPEFSGLDREVAAAAPWLEELDTWLEELAAWLKELPEWLKPRGRAEWSCAAPGGAVGGVWGAGTGLLLALAAGLLAWFLLRWLRRRRRAPPEAAPEAGEEGPETVLDRTPEDWRARGLALAAAGDFRHAVRHLVVGLLVALHRRRLIDLDPARTTWDYLPPLAAQRPAATGSYRALMSLFDRAWYGRKPTGRGEWEAAGGWADDVLARTGDEDG